MDLRDFLFKNRNNIVKLAKLERREIAYSVEDITEKLENIEKEIQITTQEIFQAQIVRFRSIFTRESNLIDGFKRKIVESTANTSSQWHQKQLILLNHQRRNLQIELDRLTGRTWHRRINTWIRIISLSFIILFSFSLIIMGLLTALYLLPIFAMLILGFILIKKININ